MRTIPTIGRDLTCRELHRMTITERMEYWDRKQPELTAALRSYQAPKFETPAKLPFVSRMELTQGDS